jgi:hypothetical protein
MVGAMAEYQVQLVLRDADRRVSGFFVYRGDELPKVDDVIAIEPVTDARVDWFHYASTGRAYVTHLWPNDEFPIHATELEP